MSLPPSHPIRELCEQSNTIATFRQRNIVYLVVVKNSVWLRLRGVGARPAPFTHARAFVHTCGWFEPRQRIAVSWRDALSLPSPPCIHPPTAAHVKYCATRALLRTASQRHLAVSIDFHVACGALRDVRVGVCVCACGRALAVVEPC